MDKCVLLKDQNTVMLVRLEPVAPMSRVKHSTTEPLSQGGSDGVFFRKTIIFQGSRGGPTFSKGGLVQLCPGGGGPNAYFHKNLSKFGIFQAGGPPIPPLDPRMFCLHLQLGPGNRSTYVVCVPAWRDWTKFSQASLVSQRCVL